MWQELGVSNRLKMGLKVASSGSTIENLQKGLFGCCTTHVGRDAGDPTFMQACQAGYF